MVVDGRFQSGCVEFPSGAGELESHHPLQYCFALATTCGCAFALDGMFLPSLSFGGLVCVEGRGRGPLIDM
jgi:hypothetical protein